MKYWLTTDTHFGHAKLIQFGRPEDFTDRLLAGLKGRVKEDDVVIHLGDFCVDKEDEHWHKKFFESLNGAKKILIKGNHEQRSNTFYMKMGWDMVCDSLTLKQFGYNILLKHIPTKHVDAYDVQIHGHTHGDGHRMIDMEDYYDPEFHIELAMENTDYQPVVLDKFLHNNRHELRKSKRSEVGTS